MLSIYNIVVSITWQLLKLLALVNTKLSLFVKGRKQTFATLKKHINETDKTIWLHAASLGEYEQGLPILERLRLEYPDHKLVLTFFSPSGYEIKKNTKAADVVTYLPMDTQKKVVQFLDTVHPELAVFVKYEIWPNYLAELGKRKIPAVLISGLFRKSQIFFKAHGGFMRKSLGNFSHFYVQDSVSKELLKSIKLTNTDISGDTRFDRVSEILERDNNLGFMNSFSKNYTCFAAGSTWPEDEEVLVDFMNTSPSTTKFVIAPHNIKRNHISNLKASITKSTVLFSEIEHIDLKTTQVLIIDTIGLLTKIYSYADIAYVGGGFVTGLHNTLEPAVFGVPVIIGPNYNGFLEAEKLVELGGVLPVSNKREFCSIAEMLITSEDKSAELGQINSTYIEKNKGASVRIMDGIRTLLK
ncbi:3-deoxy-D-manno-octulosonic acid transferase [Maribacter sp. MJ134]|uniref:3-deoxy-D-manno-octulosonic acid transferase n=1 Tax=Maribacter sp. MJ134 TaxID=2496865 RepID=UPI000F81A217|nr:glycosyltransferase N-terminal domain-containing protein [Maribacter sp. MJ134]AZQ59148.1 3-deoxy-D-manno-octulosonic acid transferase [Maribacter sp. MJ134]